MKKVISIILCIVVISSTCLSGCGQKKEDGPVTITIWHDKEEDVARVLEDALNVLEPEINIVLEKKEGLTDSLKLVGNDPEAAPDMYFFAHDKIGVYAGKIPSFFIRKKWKKLPRICILTIMKLNFAVAIKEYITIFNWKMKRKRVIIMQILLGIHWQKNDGNIIRYHLITGMI